MKILLTIFVLVMSLSLTNISQAAEYRHVVLFQFKDSATEAQVSEIEEAFIALGEKIEEIQALEWGENVSPEGVNDGLTHCFFVSFKSKSELEKYLPHPAHKAFVAKLKPILEKVVVVDYVAQHVK